MSFISTFTDNIVSELLNYRGTLHQIVTVIVRDLESGNYTPGSCLELNPIFIMQ